MFENFQMLISTTFLSNSFIPLTFLFTFLFVAPQNRKKILPIKANKSVEKKVEMKIEFKRFRV